MKNLRKDIYLRHKMDSEGFSSRVLILFHLFHLFHVLELITDLELVIQAVSESEILNLKLTNNGPLIRTAVNLLKWSFSKINHATGLKKSISSPNEVVSYPLFSP